METAKRESTILEQVRVGTEARLAALWAGLMFIYIYADILGFYTPGVIDQVRAGEIGSIRLNEGFLLVMAVWMAVPAGMVVLSLVLPSGANRWTNIVVAGVSLVVLCATLFAGSVSPRYAFHAIGEAVLIVAIVWRAWRWPRVRRSDATTLSTPGEEPTLSAVGNDDR
jgi:hypothetical protein